MEAAERDEVPREVMTQEVGSREEISGEVDSREVTSREAISQEDSEYVASFKPLVEFLGVALGESTEVVLHDVSDLDHSVIAIANSHVTQRTVGSPATDLMLRVLRAGEGTTADYLTGYEAITPGRARTLRSSTFFIRRRGRIIGMLCLNSDQTVLRQLDETVKKIASLYFPNPERRKEAPAEKPEILASSVADMKTAAMESVLSRYHVSVDHLTQAERLEVVRSLDEDGFFQLRGAVTDLALAMNLSEPTVYRYLRQARA
ncbi:helix-turn-helix transcriptional regulator [Actinotignum timonense]|uniref:helix-turn-helix transcriptional regulator n=1 Tax=Actinotignum TaxID=1653174 RepID=UPI0025505EA3|nr:PAS domain-containing protein [Actinotignum timonense]MDK6907484.1 PAS domain-containing protein [Actinotignum timonense]MDK8782494.1 PAS domain-containing protein [Actinotignum timonense]MDY5138167.1 PAS domain-containing protein [Actinotignum timonense]